MWWPMEEGSKGRVLKIDSQSPDPDHFIGAVQILSDGGVIAYPTETFYGLGADPGNPEAISRLFRIKKREAGKATLVVIHDRAQLNELVAEVPSQAEVLIKTFWPGPLTLLFKVSSAIPGGLPAGTGKIGVRIPSHPVSLQLIRSFGHPLTSTSANRSGEEAATTAAEVLSAFGDEIDLIIDGGTTPGKVGSTVVDVTYSPPRLVRDGWIPFKRVLDELGYAATEDHDW